MRNMHQLIDAGNWLIDDSVERVIERHEAEWEAELEAWDARNVIEIPEKEPSFGDLLSEALRLQQNQRIPTFPLNRLQRPPWHQQAAIENQMKYTPLGALAGIGGIAAIFPPTSPGS